MAKKMGKKVMMVECYAIYKSYDANAPDAEAMFFTTDKKVAERICEVMNALKDAGLDKVHCEGFEWCGCWCVSEDTAREEDLIKNDRDLKNVLMDNGFFEDEEDQEAAINKFFTELDK